ncbi:MAG: CmpA/NrtA family ABC transporter substrate-binding protein [Pseudomonadota bacterium]
MQVVECFFSFDARPVTAESLSVIAERRRSAGQSPITFAMVYPFSSHNYLLRYWLAASGLHPDKDVRLIVVPPPDMVRLCESESIDGFCVGEPWNTLAVHRGIGHQIVAGSEIWPAAPEKVLGLRRDWMDDHQDVHHRLVCALMRAVRRLQSDEGKDEAVGYLSEDRYIGLDPRHISRALGSRAHKPLSSLFDPSIAGFPWHSKAAWIAMQMVRWGQLHQSTDIDVALASSFRTDLFRQAAKAENVRYPLVDSVVEGAHDEPWPLDQASIPMAMPQDRMMDRVSFDVDAMDHYVDQFPINGLRKRDL